MKLELLKMDKTFLNVNKNNMHVDTQVYISWGLDEFPENDFDFGNEKENKEYLMRFETGELLCVWIQVKAKCEGEEGTDSLGMCHVKANDLESEIMNIVAEHDMKNNACIELRNNILCTAKRMEKYLVSGRVK